MEYRDEQIANIASLYHRIVAHKIALSIGVDSPGTLQNFANDFARYTKEVPEGVRKLLQFNEEGLLKILSDRKITPQA